MFQRLNKKARRLTRGPSSRPAPSARLNFSFVLHEHPDSDAVRRYVRRAADHAERLPGPDWRIDQLIGFRELEELAPDLILSATIGLPRLLGQIASAIPTQPAVMLVDRLSDRRQSVTFFRAPARLKLPEQPTVRVAVAAAILRPGGRSVDLVSHGLFTWPESREATIQALEDLIRAHIAQWMPPVPIWDAPADSLLPLGEIDHV